MDAETASRALLLMFMLVDMWGLLCGIDLVRQAWRQRKIASFLQGYAEMGFWMTMNVALWLVILAQAFIWPVATSSDSDPTRAAILTTLFFAASVTITLALHRGRSLLLHGPPRPASSRKGEDEE